MPSHYIYISVLFLCAPLILSVMGTFTALAIVTSSLALFVISIRLGFLVVEFSGGVVLDYIGWRVKRVLGSNNSKDTYNIKSHHHHHGKKYRHNSNKINTYSFKNIGTKQFLSNDANKRPNVRRTRSDLL